MKTSRVAMGSVSVIMIALLVWWIWSSTSSAKGANIFFGATSESNATAAPTPYDEFATPPAALELVPTTTEATADLRGYTNSELGFSLQYPKNLTVKEYKETGGGTTITFQDDASGDGFQIYALPYTKSTIDAGRFKMDEPSGVMREPVDIIIDGVRGTMFFGQNTMMGETREVWLINRGYLFEIATYKELDPWLSEIMRTWKFASGPH